MDGRLLRERYWSSFVERIFVERTKEKTVSTFRHDTKTPRKTRVLCISSTYLYDGIEQPLRSSAVNLGIDTTSKTFLFAKFFF